MESSRFNTRLGFLLVSAGCAIGLGNVWKFPFITGQYGGGLFVLLYLACLFLFGLPILIVELSIGRGSRNSAVKIYDDLEPKGTKWHWHGKVCLISNYVLMMFYTVVTGWILIYVFKSMCGDFTGLDSATISAQFTDVTNNPILMVIITIVVVIIGSLVCSFNVQKGLERVTKYLMFGLFILLVIMVVYSLTLSGAAEGLKFYLVPDFDRMSEHGFATILFAALSQAFFTLSIGCGTIATMGMYMSKERTVPSEAIPIALLDTVIAIMAGLIIFPACFTNGISPDAGPNLLFVTMSTVFGNIPGGNIWGTLFFIFMAIAALSTVFTVFESIITSLRDEFGMSKKKAAAIHCIVMVFLTLPCILGFNVLSGIQPFGDGSNIMDLEDFLISNILLPTGGLVMALFCTLAIGWGWEKFRSEANEGKGLKLRNGLKPYFQYILPVLIIVVLIIGVIDKFK